MVDAKCILNHILSFFVTIQCQALAVWMMMNPFLGVDLWVHKSLIYNGVNAIDVFVSHLEAICM